MAGTDFSGSPLPVALRYLGTQNISVYEKEREGKRVFIVKARKFVINPTVYFLSFLFL